MQNKRYIGIDPDISDIGIAVLENKNIETYTKNIGEALVSFAKTDFLNTIFRVEAGWLNKSNWHTIDSDNAKLAAEKGRRTGENHGSGKVIVQFLIAKGANVELVRPIRTKTERYAFVKKYVDNIKFGEESDALFLLSDILIKTQKQL